MHEPGKLYGIGVGPGDPELLTIKAARRIRDVDIIYTAASTKNSYSLAVEIARPYISESTDIEILSFPMTSDQTVTRRAWEKNAKIIAEALKEGKNSAFLTLGDPLTYSTFGYILKSLNQVMPDALIETIPGITSFHAASARLNRTLVEAEESLLITSGAYGGNGIRNMPKGVKKIVMLKAYKNIHDINCALRDTGFDKNCVAISKCGRNGEQINYDINMLEKKSPDYWTLILAEK